MKLHGIDFLFSGDKTFVFVVLLHINMCRVSYQWNMVIFCILVDYINCANLFPDW